MLSLQVCRKKKIDLHSHKKTEILMYFLIVTIKLIGVLNYVPWHTQCAQRERMGQVPHRGHG